MPYNVDDMINKMSGIEDAAARIVAGAEDEKLARKKAMDEKMLAYDRELGARVQNELSTIKDKLSREEAEELDALAKEAAHTESEIEAMYAMNKDRWSERIFRSIIEV